MYGRRNSYSCSEKTSQACRPRVVSRFIPISLSKAWLMNRMRRSLSKYANMIGKLSVYSRMLDSEAFRACSLRFSSVMS